jgi:UDP-N-acetylmuramoyl-tripeptide--D-alanyl-D-alanine ligase
MIIYAALAVVLLAYLAFAYRRLRTFLHIYQQEEYDAGRFFHWLIARRAFDRKASIGLLLASLIDLSADDLIVSVAAPVVGAIALGAVAFTEADPAKKGKKPLVLTARAKRLFWTAWSLLALLAVGLFAAGLPLIVWLVAVQVTPLALIVATGLWAPYERYNNARFINEARAKLKDLNPLVIGITGSFGKTSVKHILGHIMGTQAPTLITPGSVNTELGITRIVREKLMPRDKFFVCEMGAYGKGSIAKLCRLAPPGIGILTAIGHAHYERFKSLDSVAAAKLELGEAVIAKGGKMILNQDTLEFAPVREFAARHRPLVSIVGEGADADFRILSHGQTAEGTTVEIEHQGTRYSLKAPLFGEHHAFNIALAFAAASALGLDADSAAIALSTTPQIKHRSEVKPHASGATIIDDAYNSNPTGFAGGLALLDLLRQGQGRRILISPGMVELGAAHDELHAKIGAVVARHVDIFLPVLPERLGAMIRAYKAGSPSGTVLPQANLQGALDWMNANLKSGDVVLLENDLPDLYEAKLSL